MSKWIITKHTGILNTGRMLVSEQLRNFTDEIDKLEKYKPKEAYTNILVPALKSLQSALNYIEYDENFVCLINELIQKILGLEMVEDANVEKLYNAAKKYLEEYKKPNELKYRQKLINKITKFLGALNNSANSPNLHGLMSDYNRIVYSSAFRRLQHKAQIFSLEKYDYARTRLTHTVEVSAMAADLGNMCCLRLYEGNPYDIFKRNMAFYFEKICACGGLLHDLGNPPFGHFGEEAIKSFFKKNWDNLEFNVFSKKSKKATPKKISSFRGKKCYSQMKNDFTRFDGNAQGFRVASKVQMYKAGHSLELFSCVLGSMIKYPHASNAPFKKEKFGYFYSEQKCIDDLRILGVFQKEKRNPFVYLVEAADDICYQTSDFDDTVKKKILTYEIFTNELFNASEEYTNDARFVEFRENFKKYYEENVRLCAHPFEMTIQRISNDLRNELMKEATEAFTKLVWWKNKNQLPPSKKNDDFTADDSDENFMKKYECLVDDDFADDDKGVKPSKRKNIRYKRLLDDIPSSKIMQWINYLFTKYIYTNKDIIETELAGYKIITKLLEDFVEAVLRLDFTIDNGEYKFMSSDNKNEYAKERRMFLMISTNFVDTFRRETKDLDSNSLEHIYYRLRLVVDYISGMTDSYASKVYKALNGIEN